MNKCICLMISILCFTNVTYAQQSLTVSGIITDINNETIIGASVREKGASNGTVSDIDGKYTINVANPDAILEFSYLGMKNQEIKVSGKQKLDVVMEENSTALNEVVVTALGIKREAKALGYAVAEVNSEDLTAGRENNIMSALSGKVAGVDISSTSGGPSGSTRVVIRGNTQLMGSNLPLYVIDGVPMDNTQQGQAGEKGGFDWGDGLSSLSPDDIESVSVLKGGSAGALYGSRAANGVVLITTKSGSNNKNKKLGITYSSDVTIVNLLSHFDDYQRVYGQGLNGKPPMNDITAQGTTMSAWGAKLDPNMETYIYNGKLKPYGNKKNNVLSFFDTGTIFNNAISLDGGKDETTFRVSLSDMRNNDIVPASKLNRTTFMVRGTTKLSKNLTLDARVNYTYEKVNNRPALSDESSNIGNAIIGIAPNFDQRWLAENYKDDEGQYYLWNNESLYRLNPYWVINEMRNQTKRNRFMGYIKLEYQILPYLSAQVRGATDYYTYDITEFTPKYTPGKESGQMMVSDRQIREDNYEAMLRFNKRFFDKLDVSAFIGGNIMVRKRKEKTTTGIGQVNDGLQSINNYNQKGDKIFRPRSQINSVFGAVNLGYNDYAYMDFTLRRDQSSTLPKKNWIYYYPSVSGSFIFSNYFNLEQSALSFGKIRASWSKVGSDTDPYLTKLRYGLNPLTFLGQTIGQIASSTVPNPNLKSTSTYSYEFGTDLRFFKERITLDFTYYHMSSKDQIMNLPVSLASGYPFAMINAGEIVNKGMEVALSGIPVQTGDFEWEMGANFAKNWNKVEKLHPDMKEYPLASARWGNAYIVATEGGTYGNIVGTGFKRAPDGNIIFKDGMPQYDDKMKVLGNGQYDFTIGITQTFRYKDFTLKMLFDMKFGADLYSMTASQARKYGTSKATLEGREAWNQSEREREMAGVSSSVWKPTGGYVGNGVTEVGTDADGNPIYEKNTTPVDPQRYWQNVAEKCAEPFIYDASFIKLRELNVTYNIPRQILAKTPIRSAAISFYARNLWTIYDKVDNIDPESDYSSSNGKGFEYGSLPSRRNFGFGINVKF
ncbi:MAG: SusC/RagA family TonB-linked outer membrane protein [Dysgonomonas sp.]